MGIYHHFISQDDILLDLSNSIAVNSSHHLENELFRMEKSTSSSIALGKKNKKPIKKIALNTADVQILQTIPYIGPKSAEAIIAYRNQLPDKKFHSLQQLLAIKGISHKILDRIRIYLLL